MAIQWEDVADFYPSPMDSSEMSLMNQWLQQCASEEESNEEEEEEVT